MEKHEIINHFIETWLGHKKLFANSSFWDLSHKLQTHWNSYLLPQWLINILDVNGKLMWIRKSIGRYWFPIVWSKSIELRELIRSDWKGVQTGQKGSPASHLLLHRSIQSQLGTESVQQTHLLSRHISRHIYTPDILSVILSDIFPLQTYHQTYFQTYFRRISSLPINSIQPENRHIICKISWMLRILVS